MHQPERMPEEQDVFTLTDEAGQEFSFLLNATLEWQGKLQAVLYPYDPEAGEIINEKVFFVLGEGDDTLSAVDTEDVLAQLDQLYTQLEQEGQET